MGTDRINWTPLLPPTLLAGGAVSAGAYWMLSGAAAAFVLGGCTVSLVAAAVVAKRQARAAGARLRRPELRGGAAGGLGLYAGILDEAARLLDQSEASARDATQARAETEARSNVRRKQISQLQAALDSLCLPLLITDVRDQVVYCNPAAAALFGSTGNKPVASAHDQPDGERRIDLAEIPELKRLVQRTRDRNAATRSRTAELEVSARRAHGPSTVPGRPDAYRATATSLCDGESSLLGVVVVLEDVTEERDASARHAEFVSSVCHELKTPMAGIRAYAEMLVDGDVTEPDEQRELFGFIEGQVDRLTRLVDNMLNLTRIESGVIEIEREDCGLNDVLESAVDVVEQLAEEKQQTLRAELSELYLPVHVDQDLLGQAVINLLSNAVKYTPEGGEIRLRSRQDEERVIVEVRDSGMGIPPESLPHIFDRFYRVPQNNKAAAGTGLGLALVHYIVTELHNGSVAVESQVGEGTTFTISIPLGHRDQNRRKQQVAVAAT